jgi:hypothetical protein
MQDNGQTVIVAVVCRCAAVCVGRFVVAVVPTNLSAGSGGRPQGSEVDATADRHSAADKPGTTMDRRLGRATRTHIAHDDEEEDT